jgi:glycosyltransferase involved in cell wall biosynthesis
MGEPAAQPAAQLGPLPAVSVVIATRGRPELLRSAVRAALAQDYPGAVEVIVVFDGIPIDALDDVAVDSTAPRSLATIVNSRTPGLAGGRNTGILAATGEFVAFCDDDDEWMPRKLAAQLAAWEREPSAVLVATGIRILTTGDAHERLPPASTGFADLLLSRVTEIHPSSFLLRAVDLRGRIGLVDEELPASYGEDYDLLLRATRFGTVLAVREPLVIVRWNRVSFFSGRWQGIADGLRYLLEKYPEFATTPVGSARLEGQIAFALAALGDRPQARYWARRAIGHDRSQLRAYAALAIAARLAPAGLLVSAVNRRGFGL